MPQKYGSVTFETNVQPEENIYLFAMEYITTLWTSNEKKEEEPVLFSIRDKVDCADSMEELYQTLNKEERFLIEQLLYDEWKWCEETLKQKELTADHFQQITVLRQAYHESIQLINCWKAAA
jgi:ABC-type metal ion transport system substrate-binding protein